MNFVDRTLTCADCGAAFTFSTEDQAYHQERGYTNEPRRCPTCRAAKRTARNDGGYGDSAYGGQREMFSATCSECGKEALVPFQPHGDKPVYCSDCFRSRRPTSDNRGSGGYGRRW